MNIFKYIILYILYRLISKNVSTINTILFNFTNYIFKYIFYVFNFILTYSFIGRGARKNDLIQQSPKSSSSFTSKRVRRELLLKDITKDTDLKIGIKDSDLPDQHVPIKQQKNCLRNLIGKINVLVAEEIMSKEKSGY